MSKGIARQLLANKATIHEAAALHPRATATKVQVFMMPALVLCWGLAVLIIAAKVG